MSLPNSLKGKRPTWVEVNLSRLEANYLAVRKFLPDHVKIMAVIKANAYGHGAVRIAQRLEKLKVDALAVAILEEALALREAGIQSSLLLLNGFWSDQAEMIVRSGVVPAVYRLDMVDDLDHTATLLQKPVNFHLKVDTGMSRLGIDWTGAASFLEACSSKLQVFCTGIYTHLSSAETPESPLNSIQISRFRSLLRTLGQVADSIPWRHVANSAALLNFEESWFDGVRPGLVLYGVNPLQRDLDDFVRPILSFKTRIMQLRRVKKGDRIGYGGDYVAAEDGVIAVLPVGYADGLIRLLSNRGQALVRNQKAKFVGRISMDLTLIDVTKIPDVQVDDEVVLIGQQGDQEIRVEDIAALAETIPYEILCGISSRVPRVYVES